MTRWTENEEDRLRPQEQALLALCDRLAVLELAFTAEIDAHQMTRKRMDRVERDLVALQHKVGRLK